MATSNEEIRDALVRHQIGLLRVSGSLRNAIVELLNATEGDLRDAIKQKVADLVGRDLTTTASLERLKALDAAIRSIRTEAHDEAYRVWREEFRAIALHEPEYLAGVLTAAAPVVLELATVDTSYLRTLVDTYPFEGKVLKDWAAKVAQADIDRITGQVRIGLLQGETAAQIAARVVGTAAARGADGVTEITRRDANALTRTATNAFANAAREAFSEQNDDLGDQEGFIATLDGRTTPVCRSLDGNVYRRGEGPRPPMHWQCRSIRVMLLNGSFLGSRPLKASTEQMLAREYSRANSLDVVQSRAALPRGHKAEFDKYARRRVRELTGTTPAATTYAEFLKRQTAEFQDDVLGQAKGRLFRQGGLTLDKFVDAQGKELPLRELARTERAAFVKAGLDPERWG